MFLKQRRTHFHFSWVCSSVELMSYIVSALFKQFLKVTAQFPCTLPQVMHQGTSFFTYHSVLLITVILVDMKWYLTVLITIFLVVNDVKYILMFLLATYIVFCKIIYLNILHIFLFALKSFFIFQILYLYFIYNFQIFSLLCWFSFHFLDDITSKPKKSIEWGKIGKLYTW